MMHKMNQINVGSFGYCNFKSVILSLIMFK